MPTLECSGGLQPAGCRTADGRLWFPTTQGLVGVNPDDVKVNRLPPPVVFEELRVDGQLVKPTGRIDAPPQIPPGRQRFEFRYTGLSFTVPEKVRFRVQLEGVEKDWTEAGTERVAVYRYIQPGDYTFRVIACNNDGIWNDEGAAYSFQVLPHFWQTWWFRLLSGLAAAALVAGSVWFIARRRLHRKLERLERQQAIERERARIAKDIHDDLGASLTRITMLSQSVRGEVEESAPAARDLDRIYTTARELTRAMDEIVWAVNPKHDTLDSLATYLGRFAQDFLAAAHVRCRLDVPMHLPAWPLTAETRHNLFLAFKEALHNIVKHAAAAEVRVSLIIERQAFTLCIEDQGRGFLTQTPAKVAAPDSARLATGNGLSNMQQRLAEIGGRCEIQSAPGTGTKVAFIVPVRAPGE
jgi:signal transduction histidine kinase